MFFRRVSYLVYLDNGADPTVAFQDGGLYSFSGTRDSTRYLRVSMSSFKWCNKKGVDRSIRELVDIIDDDLRKDGIFVRWEGE